MTHHVSEAVVRARMPSQLRAEAEAVFGKLGITPSAAVRILYAETVRKGALPFSTKIPNKATAKALNDALTGKGVFGRYDNVEDAFAELLTKDSTNEGVRGIKTKGTQAARKR